MDTTTGLDGFLKKFGSKTETYKFYNDTVTLLYDVDKHVYLLEKPDGTLEEQDGVTSVIHIIDKSEALVPWSSKMCSEKMLKTVPRTGLCGRNSVLLTDETFTKLAISAKSAHKDKLEDAGNVGHTAHAWIEQWIKRELGLGSIDLCEKYSNPRATNAFHAALDWMEKHKVKWICTERKVYSREYKYAGTCDGLAYVSSCSNSLCCTNSFIDRLSLIDWKTSNYLFVEYLLQTAAYQQAYTEETGQIIEDRWILRLGKEEAEFEPWYCEYRTYDTDLTAFLTCLSLKRNMARIKEFVRHRQNAIKVSRKEAEIEAKNEAYKLKCKNADRYKGVRKPTCNDGSPCKACLDKYESKHGVPQ